MLCAWGGAARADSFGHGDGHWGSLVVSDDETVLNEHTRLASDAAAGATQLSVVDGSIFAVGDLVLIWQPTGATGSSSASSASAIDLGANAAGQYELARLVERSGNTLTLRDALEGSFSAAHAQALYVPEYTDVTITAAGVVEAEPWDPVTRTGGIVAFMVQGALVNDGLVHATGRGQRGGAFVNGSSTDNCDALDQAAPAGAQKGEGLTGSSGASTTGRGNLLNGGGGGNCAESGGAGGGLGGVGGKGGGTRTGRDAGGAGGRALASGSALSDARLFMGAGGGAGHGDSSAGGAGGAGGGVVFVRARSVSGAGFFSADGAPGTAGASGDGAGGGGAGGSVLVQALESASCALRARGGNGGSAAGDHGAGGGGGGGRAIARAGSGSCARAVDAGAAGSATGTPAVNAAAGAVGVSASTTPGLDIDADDDGVWDAFEDATDPDDDALPAYLDDDDDGDLVPTLAEAPGDGTGEGAQDSDDDGTPDYLDTDDDGDLVPTADEDLDGDDDPQGDDTDADETANYLDTDDDGDGIPTLAEDPNDDDDPRNDDSDLDLAADYCDADDDDDDRPTQLEDVNDDGNPLNDDTDLDGLPDYRDADDDHDRVPTIDEVDDDPDSAADPDTDGDGKLDYLDVDDDGDGAQTRFEDVDGDGNPQDDDTDADETANFLDEDDDGDGLLSKDEDHGDNGTPRDDDSDADETADYLDADDDEDGVHTRFEDGDSDEDGTPNHLDTDDDDDGLLTEHEAAGGEDGDPADARDTDGDETADYLDRDDDGDGITTKGERSDPNKNAAPDDARDFDEDGKPDYLDADDDNDSAETKDERPGKRDRDSDIDGDFDHLDADDDDDGLKTRDERPDDEDRDTDDDGLVDHIDDDDDGDGRGTAIEHADSASWDDGLDDDDVPAWLDDDSDGDGALDVVENALTGDLNQDGRPDYLDPSLAAGDRDEDGVADFVECPPPDACPDTDGNGRANPDDDDDDGDGISTRLERPDGMDTDSDGDLFADHLDADDDGDGIPTRDELGLDSDDDEVPDYLDEDDDGDGIATSAETSGEDDVDSDGTPNWLDLDSDDDGYSDHDEREDGDPRDPDKVPNDADGDGVSAADECGGVTPCPDTDEDGIPDDEDDDDDNDGIPTRVERPDGMPVDHDGDDVPDYLDRDDDGDSVNTEREREDAASEDADGDGAVNWRDTDDDGDGVPTEAEAAGGSSRDDDADGKPNYLDDDDDGDDISTAKEQAHAQRFGDDVDGDYLSNYLDIDSDGDGLFDYEEPSEPVGDEPPDYLRAGAAVGGALCSGAPRPSTNGSALLGALVLLALCVRRRTGLLHTRAVLALATLLLVSACAERTRPMAGSPSGSACSDRDGDGYGEGCALGADCDEHDPDKQSGCDRCATPNDGCACQPGTEPATCFMPQTEGADGTLMCNEGTRYCRQGRWSGCENVHSYPPPEPQVGALVDRDSGLVYCSDCEVNCFVIRDNLDPVDGGLTNVTDGIEWNSGGGLKLAPTNVVFQQDAGYVIDGGVISGPNECVQGVGSDSDCDGIEDDIDPYPFERPFATTNPAIFLDLAPGETGTGVINLQFYMNSLDVYFLLDQTDSMNSVRNRLEGALATGSFLDPSIECADIDFDGVANQELKNQGLLGGMRCLLRNAYFGTGYFREIPFTTYGHNDEVTFEHMLDMTQDTTAALDSLALMDINRDVDWPDAHPLALYSVVTGEGLYMGLTKPGVPPRVDCPAGYWGYPCFRPDAIPVVVMFTDSPQHEGPPIAARDFSYDPSILTITAGSNLQYVGVPRVNETFTTAFAMGDITTTFQTYAGTTSGMASNYDRSLMACLGTGEDRAPDATFTFTLNAPTAITYSTEASAFDAAVAIYSHVVETPAMHTSDQSNETALEAFDVGTITDGWSLVTGSTAGMNADFKGSDVGCGASDGAADAVFELSLARNTTLSLDAKDSGFNAVISLHDRPPAIIESLSTNNQNDVVATALSLGNLNGRILNVTGGDTTAGSIAPNYTEAEIGCSADSTSGDAVYHFTLDEPARVRIDTTGSSFDTVLGLADGMLGAKTLLAFPDTADIQETAFDIGDLVHQWYGISGTTATLDPNYRQAFIGCNAHTQSPDGVVRFSLSERTTVSLDSSGSGFDTVLSLHNGDIDPTTPLNTDNNNETAEQAMYLGEADDKWFEVFGGNTALMRPDYTDAVVSCGSDTYSADAVFSFDVLSTSTIRIDTLGASYDTVVSLHDNPPPRHVSQVAPAGESFDVGSANDKSIVYTGSSVGKTSDYGGFAMGCGTEDTPSDVVVSFTLTKATALEINTEGSDYDTAIGLFPSTVLAPKRPAATALASNTNEAKATAYDAGVLDGTWKVFSGNTSSMAANFGNFGCDTANAARDAVYKFTLNTARTVTIDTRGSATDMVLGLYNNATDAYLGCDDDSGGGNIAVIKQALAIGTYYVVVKGDRSNDRGAYEISIRDDSVVNPILCNDDAFVSGRSQILANLTAGSYKVVLKGARAGHEGNFALRITDRDWFADTNRLACDDNGAGGVASMIERQLNPGTYYVVLKGDLAVDNGPFMLTVRSVSSSATTSHAIACDNDSGAGTASRIEATLDPGEYWAVIKGTSGQSGLFELEARDIGAGGQGLVLACNDDTSSGTAAVIERDLSIGSYYVFVKGDSAIDEGAYSLSVRDVGAGGAALACDAPSGTEAATLTRSLTAGNYWVVMKGDASRPEGPYSLSIRDSASSARTTYACDTNVGGTVNLPAGTFDAVIKGAKTDQAGNYALTLGDGRTRQATFDPPDWEDTLAELQDRDMRVITVLNCHDNGQHGEGRDCNQAREQAVEMAHATDALGPTLAPLVIDIDSNGTGIETAVMGEINALAGHLEMDVSVRVVFEPDANPGFIVSVQAIDSAGDGCDGLIGLEHQNCRPGATPTFHITITNPLNAPVPLNPDDPNGGYNFRADLIADDKYFVDAVPIYVIPADVDMSMPPPEYVLESMGEYWQDVSSPGCEGNARPDWRDLYWTADVPSGTAIKFSVCTSSDPDDLDACTLTEVATITGGATCASDADCPRGFCAPGGVCQVIEGTTCSSDAQCGVGSVCDTGTLRCTYDWQPVYVGALLAEQNLNTDLRMNITLFANPVTNDGPVVYDWALTYLCRNVN